MGGEEPKSCQSPSGPFKWRLTLQCLLLSTKKTMRTLSQEFTVVENKTIWIWRICVSKKSVFLCGVVGHLSCELLEFQLFLPMWVCQILVAKTAILDQNHKLAILEYQIITRPKMDVSVFWVPNPLSWKCLASGKVRFQADQFWDTNPTSI